MQARGLNDRVGCERRLVENPINAYERKPAHRRPVEPTSEMTDLQIAPLVFKVLCYEPSVTVVRLVLAAQKAGPVYGIAWDRVLNSAGGH